MATKAKAPGLRATEEPSLVANADALDVGCLFWFGVWGLGLRV